MQYRDLGYILAGRSTIPVFTDMFPRNGSLHVGIQRQSSYATSRVLKGGYAAKVGTGRNEEAPESQATVLGIKDRIVSSSQSLVSLVVHSVDRPKKDVATQY